MIKILDFYINRHESQWQVVNVYVVGTSRNVLTEKQLKAKIESQKAIFEIQQREKKESNEG